jgi:hypothetical protein
MAAGRPVSAALDASLRRYVANRQARIVAMHGDDTTTWRVEAPISGQGLRSTTIDAAERPDVHRVFEQLACGDQLLELDVATATALVELGVLVAEGSEPQPVTFAVPLPVPDGPARGAWRLAPTVRSTSAPEHPSFRPGPVIEVDDRARRATFAYWLDPEQSVALDELREGRAPGDLPAHVISALAATGVLIGEDDPPPARRRSDDAPIAGPGLVTLRSLLPTPYVHALQQYTRALVREGHLALGDAQSDRRYVAHNEPVAQWLHGVLLPAVQPYVRAAIRPSYNYLLAYLDGAVLAPHTDRAQCEFTVSLAVDATPDDSIGAAWPLHIRANPDGEPASLLLAPGDAVLFTGRELEHHRDALPVDHTAAMILLHFVERSFTASLD